MIACHHGKRETAKFEALSPKGVAGRQFLSLTDRLQKTIVEMGVAGHVVIDKEQLAGQRRTTEAIPVKLGNRPVVDGVRPEEALDRLKELGLAVGAVTNQKPEVGKVAPRLKGISCELV